MYYFVVQINPFNMVLHSPTVPFWSSKYIQIKQTDMYCIVLCVLNGKIKIRSTHVCVFFAAYFDRLYSYDTVKI